MIKNDTQLSSTLKRISDLRDEVRALNAQYSEPESHLFTHGLEQEIEELEQRVREYTALRDAHFDLAVEWILRRPVLIERTGELLAKLRIAAGVTQEDLAERLGWHQSNLSRFESENYSAQTVSKIVEYASALGVWLQIFPTLTEKVDGVSVHRIDLEEWDYRQPSALDVTTDTADDAFDRLSSEGVTLDSGKKMVSERLEFATV